MYTCVQVFRDSQAHGFGIVAMGKHGPTANLARLQDGTEDAAAGEHDRASADRARPLTHDGEVLIANFQSDHLAFSMGPYVSSELKPVICVK